MSDFYLGNSTLKKAGVVYEYTKDELTEFLKCAKDPVYFAETYIHVVHVDEGLQLINLRPYQKKLLSHFHDNRNSICLSSRQSGKCLLGSEKVNIRVGKEYREVTMEALFSSVYKEGG